MEIDTGTVENESVLTLLECPVCLDHITPPIKQCTKGHLVCSDCYPRLNHCPSCRGEMSSERNLAMEQVSRLLQFPCRYHPMGCGESFPLAKKDAHERDCAFLQLKCPFHGQCAFNGPLAQVVPHLKSEHNVTPVPVQPAGTFFYRAKNFYRRNIWTLVYQWDGNLFRFIVKHVHSGQVGRAEQNCNLLIAHIQYIGPESMAASYAYQISLFDAERRRTGTEFQGLVTSTLKPLEAQCLKDDVFVTTFHSAKNYTDQWANLNFIIQMKKINGEEPKANPPPATETRSAEVTVTASTSSGTTAATTASTANTTTSSPVPSTSAAAVAMES